MQRFYDIIGFHSLNNSVLTFGDGSMFLADMDDTYVVYVVDSNSPETAAWSGPRPVQLAGTRPTIQSSFLGVNMTAEGFLQIYTDNDASKYYTKRVAMGVDGVLRAGQGFAVRNNKKELFKAYYMA